MLRAVAVLLVIGYHAHPLGDDNGAVLVGLMTLLKRCGWIGVDLFFVLSGFLVSGLLFREFVTHGSMSARRFLVRRGLKIYPAFYLFLGVSVLVEWHERGLGSAGFWRRVLGEALFIQNYGPHLWNHTWSLAIEEHFYLLLPACLLWIARRRQADQSDQRDPFRRAWPAAVAVLAVPLALRVVTTLAVPYANRTHVFPTHLRLDSLGFGVVLAYLDCFHAPALIGAIRRYARQLCAGGIVLVAPALVLDVHHSQFMHTFGFSGLYLGFGAILLWSRHRVGLPSRQATRLASLLADIGVHSYSIYLWHLPVSAWLSPWVRAHVGSLGDLGDLAVYVGGSLAVGILLGRTVELPFLRLRDRLFPSRVGPLRPSPPNPSVC